MTKKPKKRPAPRTKNRTSQPAPFDMHGSLWSLHHDMARTPRGDLTSARGLARFAEEQAVRDVLTRYTFFYDGRDLDGVMSVFHDKCTLINPRGTYIGRDAIRENYAFLISTSKVVLHFATNVLVRLSKDSKEARMGAYYYAIAAMPDGKLIGTGGAYADRLVKDKGEWKIIDRRITYNFRNTLSPEAPPSASLAPRPTRDESSRDILGPDAEM